MIGGLFAGLAESPGDTIIYRGRSFKSYRGMGSLGPWPRARTSAIARRARSRAGDGKGHAPQKLVPEGVEGRVPYKGPLAEFVFQLVGGLRAGMGYCGTRTIEELRTKARFIQVTGASVQEGHPHDIVITQEAPNYSSFTNENESGRGPADPGGAFEGPRPNPTPRRPDQEDRPPGCLVARRAEPRRDETPVVSRHLGSHRMEWISDPSKGFAASRTAALAVAGPLSQQGGVACVAQFWPRP